jgi:hypothetical protein
MCCRQQSRRKHQHHSMYSQAAMQYEKASNGMVCITTSQVRSLLSIGCWSRLALLVGSS